MIEILSNFLRSVIVLTPGDLLQCIYLCLNKIAPAYEGLELGIGESLLMRAIAQATGMADSGRMLWLSTERLTAYKYQNKRCSCPLY